MFRLVFNITLVWIAGLPLARANSEPVPTAQIEASSAKFREFRKKLLVEFKVAGEAFSRSEATESAHIAQFLFHPQFTYNFSPQFYLIVSPELSYATGRIQEQQESDRYGGGIFLRQGIVGYKFPLSSNWQLESRAGVLPQEWVGNSHILSGHRSFPGIREDVKWKSGNTQVGLWAEQTIPNSRTFNSFRQEQESLPNFFYEQLYFEMTDFSLFSSARIHLGHYSWLNLPSRIAHQSEALGNTPTGATASNAKFMHGFNGLDAGVHSRVPLFSKLSALVEYKRILNNQAPSDSRDAESFGLGLQWDETHHLIEIIGRRYFVESDVTPSVYSSTTLGNNNRVGFNFELKWHLKDLGLKVFAETTQSKPISPINTIQRDLSTYLIGLETEYAVF